MKQTQREVLTTYYFFEIDGVEIPERQVYDFMELDLLEEMEDGLGNTTWWTDSYITFDSHEKTFKELLLKRKVIKPNTYYQKHHHDSRFVLDEGYP